MISEAIHSWPRDATVFEKYLQKSDEIFIEAKGEVMFNLDSP